MNALQIEYIRANTNLLAANEKAAALCSTILPADFPEDNLTDAQMEEFVDARLEAEARMGYSAIWDEYKIAKDALLQWVEEAVRKERAYCAHRVNVEYLFAQAARNISIQNKIIEIALRLRA